MSENTTASLKQEILEWANKPGTMEKFTTHDVYEHIHSAETPSHTSDALRSMWKYDKTLDREEFMDGNKKRFVYSLKKKVNERLKQVVENMENFDPVLLEKAMQAGISHAWPYKGLTKGGAIPGLSGMSESPAYAAGATAVKEPSTHGSTNTKIRSFEEESNLIPESIKGYSIPDSVINCDNNNQQIEIPNNFCIELKTPNGFTITIKAGDLMK